MHEPFKPDHESDEPNGQHRVEAELAALRDENNALVDQYETLVTQVNQLTVKAEIAPLEFDQIFNAVGDPCWVVDKDITDRKRLEETLKRANRQLERLAAVDGLTQLANRRTFDATLQKEWRRMRRNRQPLSVILRDIDFFKRFNDHYGHQAGDECLKAVAGCINRCLQRPGDLAARYGGEEFVVILPNTPSEGALHVAETIRQAVVAMHRPHAGSKTAEVVTLSLGTATLIPPLENGDAKDLVEAADAALYQSKAAGRSRATVNNPD
jgi:diguanylate cyclase (GGDEF)-like protein